MTAAAGLSPLTRIRKERRAQGLCAELKCKRKSGEAFRCQEHAAVYAKRVARFRVRQKQLAATQKRASRG